MGHAYDLSPRPRDKVIGVIGDFGALGKETSRRWRPAGAVLKRTGTSLRFSERPLGTNLNLPLSKKPAPSSPTPPANPPRSGAPAGSRRIAPPPRALSGD